MREMTAELFELDVEVVCITTNGFVKANGEAVMGRGCAKQLAEAFPRSPRILGSMIQRHGNIVQPILMHDGTIAVAFPVKHGTAINDGTNVVAHAASKYHIGQSVAGFHLKADIALIEQSAKQLVDWVDARGFTSVALPRAGCGCGELTWEQVKPVLDTILDDRFIAVTL